MVREGKKGFVLTAVTRLATTKTGLEENADVDAKLAKISRRDVLVEVVDQLSSAGKQPRPCKVDVIGKPVAYTSSLKSSLALLPELVTPPPV